MPTYKITAPDGNSYNVTAPDGATQEQVLAYAQANYKHPAVESGSAHNADFSDVQGGALPDSPISTLDRLNNFDVFASRPVNRPVKPRHEERS